MTDPDDIPYKTIPYKYNEKALIVELQKYCDSTYSQHYGKGKTGIQALELAIDSGYGEGFCITSIWKYLQRYGKKDGFNRKDLMKSLHYALLLLYIHDQREENENKQAGH